jgi:hypothetical protein
VLPQDQVRHELLLRGYCNVHETQCFIGSTLQSYAVENQLGEGTLLEDLFLRRVINELINPMAVRLLVRLSVSGTFGEMIESKASVVVYLAFLGRWRVTNLRGMS